MAKLKISTTPSDDCGAVTKFMPGADVAAVSKGDTVEETVAVRLFCRFQFVQEAGQQFALGKVTAL